MNAVAKGSLTQLELELMQVVWRLGAGTVGDVQEQFLRPLAYTTVQTMLNILQRKGHLRRKLRGRAYEYSPTVSEEKASGRALRDLIDRVFGGSSEDLVMSLVKGKHIDPKTLAKLTKRLENEEEQG